MEGFRLVVRGRTPAMSMTMFSTEVEAHGPTLDVYVSGDLDLESAPTFLALADSLDPACRQVVLDLGGVSFIDSTGVSALVALHRAFEPQLRTLVVQGAQGQVQAVLEMSGIGEVVHLVA